MAPTRNPQSRLRGFRIATLFGIEIAADWSLLFIVGLIALNLGAGVFPAWHPEWSPALSWTLAVGAAILFIASVAAHEMSHALVGRRHGVHIRRITLFIFGGVAHMESEPPSPKAELWMAVVGPITSLAIGLLATGAGVALATGAAELNADDPAAIAASLGPAATLLLWIGPLNVLLAIFNMVPGFPLDGGRALRAVLWRVTGDLRKATRWAAGAGQLVAWTLIGVGIGMALGLVVPVLGGGFLQGLWLVLIGWFLSNAATASYQQVVIREALEDVPVSTVMRSRVETVAPDVALSTFLNEYVMGSDQVSFPVVRDGEIVGMIHMSDVRRAPRDRWDAVTVSDVMTDAEELDTLRPGDDAMEALHRLAAHEQIPIVDGRRLVGVANRRDLMKWVAFHEPARE